MADIIPFKPNGSGKHKKKKSSRKGFSGAALCANNHHKWEISKAQRFDTREGKLVTVETCQRCGKKRNRLT